MRSSAGEVESNEEQRGGGGEELNQVGPRRRVAGSG